MSVSATAAFAVLLAMALAAGLSALAARTFRRRGFAPWWGALAVGLAYVLAHAGVATPAIPPVDVTDRVPMLALAGAVVAASLAGGRDVLWARVVGYLGLAALAYVVMLGPVLGAGAGDYSRETIIQLALIAVGSLLAMLNLALLDAPSQRPKFWAALTVLALGTGVILVLANSAVLFQLGGVLALVLAASLLGAWGLPVGGGIPVAATVLTALVIEGAVYAFLPATAALVLAAAPAVLWLVRLGPLARLGPKGRVVVASGLILIPLAVAVFLVLSSRSPDGYG
jgi:hypothetical protein